MALRSTWESKFRKGDTAPSFSALLHDGSSLNSEDLKGSKVIMFFYNSDGTETCTKEACNMRDNYADLVADGFKVFGISKDSERKHQGFIAKYDLPYPLISDKDNVLAKQFDIFGEKKFMGRISDAVHRTTFVMDDDWRINQVIHPVNSKDHAAQIER